MIEAIGAESGIALALRDPRAHRQRYPSPRRRAGRTERERIEIADALAAVAFDEDEPAAAAMPGGSTVTAIGVARRLVAGADRAIAMQARLGAAAVRRLVGADG